MGESYKGLTIRIGADTSTLQRQLRAASSAASSAQAQLRRVNQALKLDPASIVAAHVKMDLLGERTQAAYAKATMLRGAYDQLKSSGVGAIAEQMQRVGTTVETAKDKLNAVNARLEETKRAFAEVAGVSWKAFNTADVQKHIECMRRLNVITADQYSEYKRLVNLHREAEGDLSNAKLVASYRDLEIEMEKAEAQARSLAREYVEVRRAAQNMSAKAEMRESQAAIERTDGAASDLERQLRRLDEALKLDPSSLGAAVLKIENMRDQTAAAKTKLESLADQMRKFQSSGIAEAANQAKDIGLQFQSAKAKLEGLTTELELARGKLQTMGQMAARMEVGGEQATEEYRQLSLAIDNAKQEVGQLEAAQRAAGAAFDTASQVQEYRRLETEIAETRAKVVSLTSATDAFSKKTTLLGIAASTWKSIGMTLYSTVTPAVLMAGYAIVRSADEQDAAFRNMKKTVNATASDYERLREAAVEYSNTHAVSADDILNIEAMGGQLGIAAENLESFATVASNLDIATDMDSETVSRQLGQMSNILSDLTEDKLANFGDALVRLGNNNAAMESSIMDVTSRMGSMGSILGFTAPQLLAWGTAIAATGQNSEAAGTAISRSMADIEAAVTGGGDDLALFASIAGMSASEFVSKWKSEPSAAMRAFVEGLKRVKDEGGSVTGVLAELGIKEVRQRQALQGLTQTTDTLNDSLIMSQNAWDGVSDQWGNAGDAAYEADQKSEGFSGALAILKNNASNLGATLGNGLTPALGMASDVLKTLNSILLSMPEPVRNGVVVLGILAGVAGPVATGVSSAATALGDMRSASSVLAGTMRKASAEMEANGAAAAKNAAGTAALAATENAGAASTTRLQAAKARLSATYAAQKAAIEANTAAQAGNAAACGSLTAAQKAQAGAMTAGVVAAKSATVATRALGAAMKVVVPMAVLGIVTDLIGRFVEYQEKADTAREATDGLREAVAASSADYSAAAAEASALSSSQGDVAKSAQECIQAQAGLAGSIRSSAEEVGTNAALVQSYVGVIDELSNKFDENGIRISLNADEQAKLKAAVSGLNGVCGTSYSVIDAVSGALDVSSGKLHENADAWIDNAKAQAAQEAYADLVKQQIESKRELDKVNKALEKSEGGLAEFFGEVPGFVDGASESYYELQRIQKDLEQTIGSDAEAQDYYLGMLRETGPALDETAEATDAAAVAMDGLDVSASDALDEITEWITSSSDLCEALGAMGIGIDEFAGAVQDSGVDFEEFSAMVEETMDAAQSLADKLAGTKEYVEENGWGWWKVLSVDELHAIGADMLDTLRHNGETVREWGDNLTSIMERTGESASGGFISDLRSMGVDAAQQMAALSTMTDEELQEVVETWYRNGELAVEAAIKTAGMTVEEYQAAIASGGEGAEAAVAEVQAAAGDAWTVYGDPAVQAAAASANMSVEAYVEAVKSGEVDASDGIQRLVNGSTGGVDTEAAATAAQDIGATISSSIASGIQNGSDPVQGAVTGLVRGVQDSIKGAAESVSPYGEQVSQSFAAGIANGQGTAVSAADTQSKQVADHFSSASKDAWWAGSNMAGQSYTQGISSGQGGAVSAARTVSKQVADHFSSANGDAWWAGYNMSAGMAQGIAAGQSLAVDAAVRMATASYLAAKDALDERSPSKKFEELGDFGGQGLAIGYAKSTGAAAAEAAKMARKTVEAAQGALGERVANVRAAVSDAATGRYARQGGKVSVSVESKGLTEDEVYNAVNAAVSDALRNSGDVVLKVGDREFARAVRKVR